MGKHIIDEKTGISYTMRGDYYLPDMYLPANGEPTYGKYGFLRLEYLREYKNVQYINLLTQGKLTEHLNAVDKEVKEKVDCLVEISIRLNNSLFRQEDKVINKNALNCKEICVRGYFS